MVFHVPISAATLPEVVIASFGCTDGDDTASYGTASLTYTLNQSPGTGDFTVSATGELKVASRTTYILTTQHPNSFSKSGKCVLNNCDSPTDDDTDVHSLSQRR